MKRMIVVLCALAISASANPALSANDSISLPRPRSDGTGATVPTQANQARANWTLALVDHIRAQTSHPELARLFGSEGVVLLYFVIDRKGAIHDARILRSSGSPLLDGRNLRLLHEAQPFPPPPDELAGDRDRIPITLPIRYRLER